MKTIQSLKMDKNIFSVVTDFSEANDMEYWFSLSPLERLEAIELMRQIIVGGYAVGYHGYPRATVDLDIWVSRKPRNAEKLVSVLKAFGFDVEELSEDLFLEENKIIRMGAPPIRIEIITSATGIDFEECYRKRVTDILDDVEVHFINLEHLKRNKKASGRYKDLDDLEHLP
jgi:hypothetical protein